MNNNICKWGVEHQKSLLEKGKNLSRRLVKKILLSLSLLGMLFVGGNAYAAADFPVTQLSVASNYDKVYNTDELWPKITDNVIDGYYFSGDGLDWDEKRYFYFVRPENSENADLTISNSCFAHNDIALLYLD